MPRKKKGARVQAQLRPFARKGRQSWLNEQSGTLADIAEQLHIPLYSALPPTGEPITENTPPTEQ
ncbi:hypothetical protein KDA_32040 [Dictyobacter alpinus]|uniref:Uncharacterized protein n=1 Tax=Dictyobacter alpinus TaxID=2014873 RepID=A0A402B8U2_9CHLR|nr:hypothetical protein [Dictyobacter alpinus]GCE27720.1 hypothetical protein KDA_32040 [Dictyobacter alpinus]